MNLPHARIVDTLHVEDRKPERPSLRRRPRVELTGCAVRRGGERRSWRGEEDARSPRPDDLPRLDVGPSTVARLRKSDRDVRPDDDRFGKALEQAGKATLEHRID